MSERIIVINTIYLLLQYIVFDREWQSRDYLILSKRIPINVLNSFHSLVNKTYIYETSRIRFRAGTNILFKEFKRHREMLKIVNQYEQVYGNIDHLFKSLPAPKQVQMDDGVLIHELLKHGSDFRFHSYRSKVTQILHYMLGLRREFDVANKKYLLPDHKSYLKFKDQYDIEFYNLAKLWMNKSPLEKKLVFDIFDFNEKILNDIKKRKSILFTQPLSEDFLCDEQEKIAFYQKLINDEIEDLNDLVIKPHPVDRTDYKQVFPNALIISSKFPSELLTLTGITFNKSITLFSSAAKSVLAKEIVFQGSPASLRSQNNIPGERIFHDI